MIDYEQCECCHVLCGCVQDCPGFSGGPVSSPLAQQSSNDTGDVDTSSHAAGAPVPAPASSAPSGTQQFDLTGLLGPSGSAAAVTTSGAPQPLMFDLSGLSGVAAVPAPTQMRPPAIPTAGTPQQAPAPAPAAGLPAVNEAHVAQLVSFGFTRQQAIEALFVCGGDPQAAANFLAGSS